MHEEHLALAQELATDRRGHLLLVKQHVENFQERFAGFPVHLRALSRFQSDKEARETIAGLADGTVD
ncbi:hypothetical protein ACC691_37880, partial [Rhizobium johnstonii]|uniref:hypothetical protein n=1 Tax=Rhizobium johnstonii TaxID=3019933 RepID=UPI003F97511C